MAKVFKKLSEAFGVTLDYLVDESGVVAGVTDREMLNRITEIDSLLRDAKAKKAYGV